jgi:hypothetical protein
MPGYAFRLNGRAVSVDSWDPAQPLLYALRGPLDRPDQPLLGAGEAATAPVAAAVANAVFDATGIRLRTAPFTPARVRAALARG